MQLALRENARNDARRAGRPISDAEADRIAEQKFNVLREREPEVIELFRAYAMRSTAPNRAGLNEFAETAATLAQPHVSRMLTHLACTPSRRAPISDLSTAVAVIVDQALRPSRCDIRHTYRDMEAGQISRRWAVNHPPAFPCESSMYRNIQTVTGCVKDRKVGHDPAIYPEANIALLRELAARPYDVHPKDPMSELHQIGYAAIFDGTRIPAPISQNPPPSAEYLRLSAGPELAGIAFSVYDHGGQKDAVTGWRHLRLVDRVTGLPMVWVDRPAVVDEAAVLVDVLVPMLFKFWSDCPLEIIISDGALDQARACGELEARYGIHPVFPRRTPKHLTVTAKRGVKFKTVNGQPYCDCRPDQEMAFYKREGFLGAEERRKKGIPRGVLPPDIIKNARIRWKCPNTACKAERTTYALKSVGGQMWPYANDHLWFPLRGAGKHTHLRKMLLLYRNLVEGSFSFQKARGVGSNQPARWAKDHGFVHLMGMHLTLRTACRLAHENGSYAVLEAEHTTLGLARDTSHPPSLERMLDLRNKRPPHLRWAWPKPQRLPLSPD